MPLDNGERQVAPSLDGIRRDHVARYEWAARALARPDLLGAGGKVLDAACGVGYGTAILADAGHRVLGIDREAQATIYGQACYARENAILMTADLSALGGYESDSYDAAVFFEAVEHLADPLPVLRDLVRIAPIILVSAPNEDKFPFRDHDFHFRHYRPAELEALLNEAGLEVAEWWGQEGPYSEVERDVSGRTLIAVARRAAEPKRNPMQTMESAVPEHVVILGLGPSLETYVDVVKRLGGRRRLADEVWAINALGDVLQCDRIFHMDDVRIQEIRAAARPRSNIAVMLEWLRHHPGPIYTSRSHSDYPGLVAFPLEEVINGTGYAYFNNTAAYAVAYAVHLGVKKISLFGCDYTYPNAHDAEKGRACLEFWLGIAAARGIEIAVSDKSSLLDTMEPEAARLYGYDTVDVAIEEHPGGVASVKFTERASLPTADEIEARYDHSMHPNALVRAGKT